MKTSFFASAVAFVSRTATPTVLAAATFCATMGAATIARADEPAPSPTYRLEGPRLVMGPNGMTLQGPHFVVVPHRPPPPPEPKVILRVPGLVVLTPPAPPPPADPSQPEG